MIKIGIVYFTNTDVTGQLVSAACEEVALQSTNVEVICHRILGEEIQAGRSVNTAIMEKLKTCNGIIFASPTYMGSVAAQFKAFADATSDFWESQQWSGKVAAGMTCGSGLNGDQATTLQYLMTLASQHGMLWVGLDAPFSDADKAINRLGCQLGVTAQSLDGSLDEVDLNSAKYLACRVLEISKKLAL